MALEVFVNSLESTKFMTDLRQVPIAGGEYKMYVPWEYREGPTRAKHELWVQVPENSAAAWKQALESAIKAINDDAADGEVSYSYYVPELGSP